MQKFKHHNKPNTKKAFDSVREYNADPRNRYHHPLNIKKGPELTEAQREHMRALYQAENREEVRKRILITVLVIVLAVGVLWFFFKGIPMIQEHKLNRMERNLYH